MLLYLGGALACVLATKSPGSSTPTLAALVVVCLGFAAFYAYAARAPYRPGGWALGLVAICIGVTGFLSPLALVLLVFWMRPSTKAAFGRL